jgi:hypothetical protein
MPAKVRIRERGFFGERFKRHPLLPPPFLKNENGGGNGSDSPPKSVFFRVSEELLLHECFQVALLNLFEKNLPYKKGLLRVG